MAGLTKKEILDQLKKLGVSSSSELNTYFEEYEEYSSLQCLPPHSPQEYYDGLESK
jgi:hypothetical protein